MAEQIASEGPVRVRVSNKWVPARPHSARRWGAKAIPACAFVALIVAAGLFSNVWLPEKWSATDLHAGLDPLTTQDTKTNPDASLTGPQYADEGGHPNPPAAQDTKTNPNTSFTAPQNVAAGGDPMAEWKLGRMYADGDGVARDDVRAFEYFSRIANAHASDSPSAPQAQIVANAFVALGRYYLNGIPNSKIKPDTERAREMFSYAASYFGNADAQYDLARLFLKARRLAGGSPLRRAMAGARGAQGPAPGAGAARTDAVQRRPVAAAARPWPDVADACARQRHGGRDLDQGKLQSGDRESVRGRPRHGAADAQGLGAGQEELSVLGGPSRGSGRECCDLRVLQR